MITAILGGSILTGFIIMFYLDARMGGGLYDPDPSSSFRNNKK